MNARLMKKQVTKALKLLNTLEVAFPEKYSLGHMPVFINDSNMKIISKACQLMNVDVNYFTSFIVAEYNGLDVLDIVRSLNNTMPLRDKFEVYAFNDYTLTLMNIKQFDKAMSLVIHPEVSAFNKGTRTAILLNKTNPILNLIQRPYKKLDLGQNSLFFAKTGAQINELKHLLATENSDVAIGLSLGYPPECVYWFDKASQDELRTTPVAIFDNFRFKCPESLFPYAKEYMQKQHNAKFINLDYVTANK